jgi:hypothetical protein
VRSPQSLASPSVGQLQPVETPGRRIVAGVETLLAGAPGAGEDAAVDNPDR